MVFYRVIRALCEDFGHFGPFASVEKKQQVQQPFLIWGPFSLINVGIKMIMPPFPTLLTHPVGYELRNKGPSLSAIRINHIHQRPVLLLSPLFFPEHQTGVIPVE